MKIIDFNIKTLCMKIQKGVDGIIGVRYLYTITIHFWL